MYFIQILWFKNINLGKNIVITELDFNMPAQNIRKLPKFTNSGLIQVTG
jgi:hypothetical protein